MAKTSKPKKPSLSALSGETLANYQPSISDQQRIKLINERYELAHMHQYPFWIDFDRYYKMYESYVNDSKSIWQTKIFIPMVFSVVERFLPRIISNKPTVNFLPRLATADFADEMGQEGKLYKDQAIQKALDRAARVQAQFDWQWDQVSRLKDGGMFMEQLRFVKEALITGVAIAKVPWRLESRDVKKYNNKQEVVTQLVKFFDGPDFELIDPYDFFFDPEAIDIQRAQWVMHRTRKTLDEMREINKAKGVEIYKNLHILEDMTPDTLSATENDFKYRRKVALGGGQVLVQDQTTDKFELMECWGMFPKLDENGEPTKDGELEPRVIVLANRSVIVRDIPYPYWHGKKPFVKFTPFPRDFEFYGIPMIKHLERMQFYMNEFVAQKFDNNVISLNQMLVVDPQSNVEDWQLVWRPGGVIRAHPSGIQPLNVGDVTSGIDNSLQYLQSASQLTTGLSDYYTSGVNADDTLNKTATGANNIEEQIASRVQQVVQIYEEQVIKEVGYQWHGLNGQFIKIPQVVRTIGTDGRPDFPVVMPEDIRYDYDIIPEAGSTQPTNQALQRNQFLQAVQVIQSNPIMAQQTDWQSVEKELWQRFGIKEGDKLMVTTPGSQPNQTPGGQQLPGAGGQPQLPSPNGANAPQIPMNNAQMLSQGMNPMPQNSPQSPQSTPGEQNVKLPGTISVKLDDLTLDEQKQWLAKLGITADTVSRLENLADEKKKERQEKNMQLAKDHISLLPSMTEMPQI